MPRELLIWKHYIDQDLEDSWRFSYRHMTRSSQIDETQQKL
jgi:hypothetical protein